MHVVKVMTDKAIIITILLLVLNNYASLDEDEHFTSL